MSDINSVRQRLQKTECGKRYKLAARALPNGKVQNFDKASLIAHGTENNSDPEIAFKVMASAEKDFQKNKNNEAVKSAIKEAASQTL